MKPTEAVALVVAVEIPRVQPVAVFECNIEEAVNDADFWDEIEGPEVAIYQEVEDQLEFILFYLNLFYFISFYFI